MAKYDEGDEVRLLKSMMVGTKHIPANRIGTIKKVKGGWGSKEYVIRWRGTDFDVNMKKGFAPNGDQAWD